MSNLLKLIVFCLVTLVFGASAGTFKLNEKTLIEAAQKGSPQLDEIQAAFLDASFNSGETAQEFAPELFGRASYAETNERAIIEFQPIFSPIKQAQLGVRQKIKNGFDASAYVVTDQRSATVPFTGKLQDATTSTLAFTVQMDIWKDLFGRNSKARLDSAQLDKKRALVEKDIQEKAFKISLRRLYWSLVANQEALNISEELLKTSQIQLNETNLRFKNSVAEADEVARYKAQASSRLGTILYFKYQRETFLKQLKNLLPSLSLKEVELAKYDLNQTMNEVLACTATIAAQPKVPYDFTQYDEAVSLLRKIRRNNSIVNSRYADADVKLFGTVKATGVNAEAENANTFRGTYGGSFDDISSTNRTGYEVGVSFTLPLGDIKKNTQRTKELYDEKRLQASINSMDAQVINTHQQLVKSIGILSEVIKAQKSSSKELGTRLRLMRKKYEQARVSVNDLVNDQDAFLNSELTTIDTQLQILNTLFDYLVIYTETPCSFNRI